MKRQLLTLAAAVLMTATSAFAQWGRPQEDNDPTGLKDAYKDYFKVGVAVNMRNITNPKEVETILREYNSVTAENDMKPISVHPREGVWTWEKADSIANFCRKNGIKMRGHCLCWHSQFCDWMFTDAKGKEVTKVPSSLSISTIILLITYFEFFLKSPL